VLFNSARKSTSATSLSIFLKTWQLGTYPKTSRPLWVLHIQSSWNVVPYQLFTENTDVYWQWMVCIGHGVYTTPWRWPSNHWSSIHAVHAVNGGIVACSCNKNLELTFMYLYMHKELPCANWRCEWTTHRVKLHALYLLPAYITDGTEHGGHITVITGILLPDTSRHLQFISYRQFKQSLTLFTEVVGRHCMLKDPVNRIRLVKRIWYINLNCRKKINGIPEAKSVPSRLNVKE
jgi:hypothetical protein